MWLWMVLGEMWRSAAMANSVLSSNVPCTICNSRPESRRLHPICFHASDESIAEPAKLVGSRCATDRVSAAADVPALPMVPPLADLRGTTNPRPSQCGELGLTRYLLHARSHLQRISIGAFVKQMKSGLPSRFRRCPLRGGPSRPIARHRIGWCHCAAVLPWRVTKVCERPLFCDTTGSSGSIASIRFASRRPFEQLFMLAGVADP